MLKSTEERFQKLLEESIVESITIQHEVVLKGQYTKAYDLLQDSIAAGITPCLVGPPGVGKSLMVRKIANDTGRPFYEVFFETSPKSC